VEVRGTHNVHPAVDFEDPDFIVAADGSESI
jgi:hypothetical protein